VVIVIRDGQPDANTSPEAEKLLMAQINTGKTGIEIEFSKSVYDVSD
jgi:hypothetical protein